MLAEAAIMPGEDRKSHQPKEEDKVMEQKIIHSFRKMGSASAVRGVYQGAAFNRPDQPLQSRESAPGEWS